MPLPELTKRRVEKILSAYCRTKVPLHLRSEVRLGYRFRGNSVTLYEERPAFGPGEAWVDIVIAQFRFDPATMEWTLYCADRNSRWQPYMNAGLNRSFDALLDEVDQDPTGVFWG
ncbi:MAG: DUF3024 domain-containing protein [Thermodesulfovibrionales bacterium]|jgi:hypothetical protein